MTAATLAGGTTIEWADYTFNPWWGCQKVSPGCDHCYADTMAKRIGYGTTKPAIWGPPDVTERRYFGDRHWRSPLKWDAQAAKDGVQRRVFCASMADVFEASRDHDVDRRPLWHIIDQTQNLIWMLLTKRPQNIMRMVPAKWAHGDWPANVWVGTTAENYYWADKRIPELLHVPAPVRFVSAEPLLGPLDLTRWLSGWRSDCADCGRAVLIDEDGCCAVCGRDTICESPYTGIDWVIAGGESGPHARPSHPDWFRSLRYQCLQADIPFFFKQWGEFAPANPDYPDSPMIRLGKKHAGRLLDGCEWNEVPQ